MNEMFGRYRIDSEIGRGGMGEVHEAYDTRNERTVALKRLRPGIADSEEYRTRFQRESRMAARLASPHVIPIHDVGEIDGRLYIDMRLVRGRDLAQIVRADGPLDPARVAVVVGQIADALHAAHEDGLIHRDVKPSNVLLAERTGGNGQDFAYLVDFGIAKSADGSGTSLTGTGAAIGTLAYMAPELFLGSAADRRVDVYALACLAQEALTGSAPFVAEGPALMYQHLSAEPPRASSVRSGLPAGVDEVLARGMAKDPEDRYGTAPELATALAGALTGTTAGTAAATTAPPDTPQIPRQASSPDPSGPTRTLGSEQPARAGAGAPAGAGTPPPPGYPPGHGAAYPGYGPGHGGPPPAGLSGPNPTLVGHPSGPQGPWYPPPSGPQGAMQGPGGPGGKRRMPTALIVLLAVLGTAVVGIGALVGIGLATNGDTGPEPDTVAAPPSTSVSAPPAASTAPSTPPSSSSAPTVTIPNAESDLALLRDVFTIGPNCTTVPSDVEGYASLASFRCEDTANGATVYYDVWQTDADAKAFFELVRNGRTTSGADVWTAGGERQGSFFSAADPDTGKFIGTSVYDDKRFTIYVVAPDETKMTAAFAATESLPSASVPE